MNLWRHLRKTSINKATPQIFSSIPANLAIISGYLIVVCMTSIVRAEEGSANWQIVSQSGHIILMRHALAPGTGDPENFNVEDCSTQRNLSSEGRNQAKKIGMVLRQNGLTDVDVYSSSWCRCLETARLLNVGQVREMPALNSFFRQFHKRESQTQELREWLVSRESSGPVVLVTHQVNITALTDVFPQSGEIIVLRRSTDDFDVVARLTTAP